MMKKINHLGIAVKDLDAQIAIYRDQLGMQFEGTEEVPSQLVKVAFFSVGESRVELLMPTSPESPIAKYLETNREGLHHVAYEVEDIRAAMAACKAQGLRLLSEEPKPGAHHTLVCFLHPKSTGGVLTELVEPAKH
ncbi:MAG TPA: methylmalonyl-CoA epimerase [Symbiobacteriaceae bacterium]|jgi:methylmalonyl-CoA/ethylmalonyl-CoA epimerase|nr:methylmalonyl-CoA epimerase [Symbiobacteriaceae bacterium]